MSRLLFSLALTSLAICGTTFSSHTQANNKREVDSKNTKQSSYYSGEYSGENIASRSVNAWLELLNENIDDSALRYKGFILEDTRLNAYILSIANNLLTGWPGSTPDIQLFILAEGSPILYTAETSTAGEIFISNGVLIQAKPEDEIAAVIAHELAHIHIEHNKELNYLNYSKK